MKCPECAEEMESGYVWPRKTFVKHALESGIQPISSIGQGKSIKTCFCVGWNGQKAIDTIMTFYAPKRREP